MTDLKRLFEPFPKEQITWRAQSVTKDGTNAMALAYIDARDVMNRLDDVCGIDGWQCKYSHANGKTICDIGIRCDVTPRVPAGSFLSPQYEWIWKADGAGDTDIEAEKGAISDAFKRAAVKWGVGRYLYDLPCPWVPCESYKAGDKYKWQKFTDDPWNYVKDAPKQPAPPPKHDAGGLTIHHSFKNAAERNRMAKELLAGIEASDDPDYFYNMERAEDFARTINGSFESQVTVDRAIKSRKEFLANKQLQEAGLKN